SVAQRRQAEAVVVTYVFGVPDAKTGDVEQGHDEREHLLKRQTLERQICSQSPAQGWQCTREGDHAIKLDRITRDFPLRMIAILLASTRVASSRLQVATRIGTDPYVPVGRRNCQCGNSAQLTHTPYATPIGAVKLKLPVLPPPPNPRHGVRDVGQAAGGGNPLRLFSSVRLGLRVTPTTQSRGGS